MVEIIDLREILRDKRITRLQNDLEVIFGQLDHAAAIQQEMQRIQPLLDEAEKSEQWLMDYYRKLGMEYPPDKKTRKPHLTLVSDTST